MACIILHSDGILVTYTIEVVTQWSNIGFVKSFYIVLFMWIYNP